MQVAWLVGLFVVGLVLLTFGARFFLQGAVQIARGLGVSPFVIGLTVVGFGTSAPELAVNLSAALEGAADMALGNVVGSNIANIGLILGVAALVRPLSVRSRLLKVEFPVMVGTALLLWLLAADEVISRTDALIFAGLFLVLAVLIVVTSRREPAEVREEMSHLAEAPGRPWVALVLLPLGLAGLVGGAELMVNSASELARLWGLSELVIGLTVVAIGTSLPELASSVAAASQGETDIAVGNVIGSNIFNILLILGVTALVQPLPVAPALLAVELPLMVGVTFALLPILWQGASIARWEGALLLLGYAGYLGWQLW